MPSIFPGDTAGSTSGGSSSSGAFARRPWPQLPRERRGHTKSRRGCYNCKRRRIKCQETRPTCGHCVRTGLECVYPALPPTVHQPRHQIPLFSMQDMRFFQHFLTQCFPHHPFKQEEVWTHEIPCIAHDHEFLMHTILGFSASELSRSDQDRVLVTAAVDHRVKAIRAIGERLGQAAGAGLTHDEANAMVAACYVLTFQSVSLDDGLTEYMIFVRGILAVGIHMMARAITPVFDSFFKDGQKLVAPLIQGLPLIPRAWADAAVAAISNLRPLCSRPVEQEYCEQLVGIAQKLRTDSFDAYRANANEYAWLMTLAQSFFQELTDLTRQVVVLLHSHWIVLTQIMVSITEQEYELRVKQPARQDGRIDLGFVKWLKYLIARVDSQHQLYNRWPVWVDEQLARDISVFGKRR